MRSFKRTWLPMICPTSQILKDSLWIYDGGDIQGWLVERKSGKQEWFLCKITSREYDSQHRIQETGSFLEDCRLPQHFFAKEQYPVEYSIQGSTHVFILPSARIEMIIMPPQVLKSHQPSSQPQALSLPQHPVQNSPALPVPPKSTSHPQGQRRLNPHSMKKVEPRMTSSPSSNQSFHGQQRRPNPAKPVRRLPQQNAVEHNALK